MPERKVFVIAQAIRSSFQEGDPFLYEFRVVPDANIFNLVCYSVLSTLFNIFPLNQPKNSAAMKKKFGHITKISKREPRKQ
jgi:hypothetical protein